MIRRIIAVVFGVAVLVFIIVLALLLFGLRPFILQSESMEPTVTKGSLVWVNGRVEVSDVEVGSVIAYRAGQSIIFHRLISISGDQAEVKGDANNASQTITLDKSNFVGVESFSIPWVGSAIDGIIHHKVIVFVIGCVLLLVACLPRRSHRHNRSIFNRKKKSCSE